MLLTDAQELIEIMGWEEKSRKSGVRSQKQLFIELTPDEKIVVDILKEIESLHIDELNLRSRLSSSAMAAATLNLELQGILVSLPGKIYKLS